MVFMTEDTYYNLVLNEICLFMHNMMVKMSVM